MLNHPGHDRLIAAGRTRRAGLWAAGFRMSGAAHAVLTMQDGRRVRLSLSFQSSTELNSLCPHLVQIQVGDLKIDQCWQQSMEKLHQLWWKPARNIFSYSLAGIQSSTLRPSQHGNLFVSEWRAENSGENQSIPWGLISSVLADGLNEAVHRVAAPVRGWVIGRWEEWRVN